MLKLLCVIIFVGYQLYAEELLVLRVNHTIIFILAASVCWLSSDLGGLISTR